MEVSLMTDVEKPPKFGRQAIEHSTSLYDVGHMPDPDWSGSMRKEKSPVHAEEES